jgi:hypothetical protein
VPVSPSDWQSNVKIVNQIITNHFWPHYLKQSIFFIGSFNQLRVILINGISVAIIYSFFHKATCCLRLKLIEV